MFARVEGCLNLLDFVGEPTEDEFAFFKTAIDLDENFGENLEISFKEDTVLVLGAGICLEFPRSRVRFYNE